MQKRMQYNKKNQRSVGARYEQVAGKYLVFCEVKYRTDRRKGMPSEAVHIRKQQVISRCALYYMTVNGVWGCPCRFDVVGILGEAGDEIRLYRNAFDYKG